MGIIRRRTYSRDEWIVLLYYFYNCPEPTQTDSHPALQAFAGGFGRTVGSIDKQMRTIKSYVAAAGLTHGAKTMRAVVDRYQNKPAALRIAAKAALRRINPHAVLP